jgi:2,4-dienoyl-CoA reductase-like NADH-dependent reductase (Old Yellow Enzyme family)
MFPKIAQLKDVTAFKARLAELGLELPVDDGPLSAAAGSPLAWPLRLGPFQLANRWCIHPMEGWDSEPDGHPSPLTLRRWRNFGRSGAALIWGGEAVAVEPSGRANPRQTLGTPGHAAGVARLLDALKAGVAEAPGPVASPVVGLQLTHSGRFSRPTEKGPAPRIAWHHPILDRRVGIAPHDDSVVWTDAQLESLIDRFADTALVAAGAGFDFVDVKACHGYLLHEFLGAHGRPGPFGGDFDGRTRLLREIIERIRRRVPSLAIGVRLSAFDMVPFERGTPLGRPVPYDDCLPYRYGFGVNPDHPIEADFEEPVRLLERLLSMGVIAVNVSCGSPYYNPHIQRPAIFPPSDGYSPPEDPLVGVCRQIHSVRRLKAAVPALPLIGTGYTYLQDYLPHVAQAVVRAGWADGVGIGRMVLSYPEFPADVLAGRPLARKRLCRTFSDCTTGPRNGLVSGCYPLDPFYKALPESCQIREIKKSAGAHVEVEP